jgi:microcystin-dependent protein
MAYSAIPIPAGGAGGSSQTTRIFNTWDQAGNSLSVGQVVFHNGTVFAPALASALGASANSVGIVEARSANQVTVVYQGEIDFGSQSLGIDDGAVSLTAGTVYYISDVTPGNLKATAPSSPNSIIAPLLVGTAAKKGIVINSLGHQKYSASIMTPVGTIVPWAGSRSTLPETWTLCDGRALDKSSTEYSELYGIIGDKYQVTSISSVTAGGPNFDTVTLSFTGGYDNHEDGVEFDIHNLNALYLAGGADKDFVVGWGGTNDYAVATLNEASTTNRTVSFVWKAAYPGTSPSGTKLQSIQLNSPVTLRSLADGEVETCATDYFFIPDLRARTVMGAGKTVGLTELYRGSIGGNQTHLLTTDEIPDHSNFVLTATGPGSSGLAALNVTAFANADNPQSYAASFTADNDAISLLNPHVVTNWIIRHKRFAGAGYEVGPQGPAGPAGPTGPTGADCNCPGPGEGGVASVIYVSKDGGYGDGDIGPFGFSDDPNNPTRWDYVTSVMTTTSVLTRTIDPPDVIVGDPSGVEKENESPYISRPGVSLPPNNNQPINRSEDGGIDTRNPCDPNGAVRAASVAGPQAWIYSEGVYDISKPFYNGAVGRDTYLGARSGSVVNRKITSISITPYMEGGYPSDSIFYMTLDTTGQSGGTGGMSVGTAILVRGLSGGMTGGNEGGTGGTAAFFDRLIGPYVVNGFVDDTKVRVLVYSESVSNSWFSPYLNTTTDSYITDIDIYKVTFRSSEPGAFFTESGTRTFIGKYDLPGGVSVDGVAFVNTSNAQSMLGDPSMLPFIPRNEYSNAIGIQTKGGYVETSKVAMVKYPAAIHATDDARVKLNDTHISHCYFGASVEDDSSLTLRGSSVSRSSIPIVAKDGSTVKITDDHVRMSRIMSNRAPIVVKGGSVLEMGQTIVRGPGVYAKQSTVNINRFTDIYNDLTAGAPATGSTQGVPENRFAIMGVDSLISVPNIDVATTGHNPAKGGAVDSKIKISGVAQFFDSKVRGSVSKTNTIISVSEASKVLSVKEDQIPKTEA